MRSFTLILLPVLSLINMGVQGASIADAVTARRSGNMHGHSGDIQGHSGDIQGHSGDIQGHSGDIQGHSGDIHAHSNNMRGPVRHNAHHTHHTAALGRRQIHNADFSAASEDATRPATVSKRDIIVSSSAVDNNNNGEILHIDRKRRDIHSTNIARQVEELEGLSPDVLASTLSGLPKPPSSDAVVARAVVPSVISDRIPAGLPTDTLASQPDLTTLGSTEDATVPAPSIIERQDIVGVTDTVKDTVQEASLPTPDLAGTPLQRRAIATRQTDLRVVETELLKEVQQSG